MTKYEMLYILSNKLEDEAKEAVIAKFQAIVTEAGGTVEGVDKWGTKKLAYAIDYQTEGYYVLVNYTADPSFVAELDRIFNITEGVMRSMTTKA